MTDNISIDVLEDDIVLCNKKLLDILLKDRTTNKNIIWATDDYVQMGDHYNLSEQVTVESITGLNSKMIQPRVEKERFDQSKRTRKRAEVFTPSWVCNKQNNLIDEQWFGRKNVFNITDVTTWKSVAGTIEFPDERQHSWQSYVDARRLEIACGEAPYLVSRYDTVIGNYIEIPDRIGLLDRKLRIVNENTQGMEEWFKWTERAFQSVYGYEYQGDNLLLARENLLYTFIDYFKERYTADMPIKWLKRIATIISWNIWQMDGITNTVPLHSTTYRQMTLFDFMNGDTEDQQYTEPCKIQDWRSKVVVTYESLVKG